jgi:hypothetical protein
LTIITPVIITIFGIVFLETFALAFNSSHPIPTTFALQLQHQQQASAMPAMTPREKGGGPFLVAIMRGPYPNQTALVNLYKPYLASTDYVVTKPNTRNLNYALQLQGLKGVEYFSLAQIEANAAKLKAKGASFISYDIEPQYTPANEIANPIAAVRNASNIVHSNGLEFMLSTTRRMDLQYASHFAPFADIYNPQGQVLQPDPSQYSSFYRDIVSQIRATNPSVKIIAQVATVRGSVQNMEQAFSLVAPYVDGVTFWYGTTADQLVMAKQFLDWLRPAH